MRRDIKQAAQDSKNSTLPPSQVKRDTLPGDILRELWATPCAGDAVGAAGGGMGRSLRTDTHGSGRPLNPDWVDCLMGFPAGWTRRDGPPLKDGLNMTGSPPRTGYGIPDRGPRLKGDGNAVVPQQFYPVMAFIATYERSTAHVSDT